MTGPRAGTVAGGVRGWPFLVGGTVHHDIRPLRVPEPVADLGMAGALAEQAGPPPAGSEAESWAVRVPELPENPLVLMRSFYPPHRSDPARPLLDKHSRQIPLFEGMLLFGGPDTVVLGEAVWRAIRSGSLRQYALMLEQEDRAGGRSAAPSARSGPLLLTSRATRFLPAPHDPPAGGSGGPGAPQRTEGAPDGPAADHPAPRDPLRWTLSLLERRRRGAGAGGPPEHLVHVLELSERA